MFNSAGYYQHPDLGPRAGSYFNDGNQQRHGPGFGYNANSNQMQSKQNMMTQVAHSGFHQQQYYPQQSSGFIQDSSQLYHRGQQGFDNGGHVHPDVYGYSQQEQPDAQQQQVPSAASHGHLGHQGHMPSSSAVQGPGSQFDQTSSNQPGFKPSLPGSSGEISQHEGQQQEPASGTGSMASGSAQKPVGVIAAIKAEIARKRQAMAQQGMHPTQPPPPKPQQAEDQEQLQLEMQLEMQQQQQQQQQAPHRQDMGSYATQQQQQQQQQGPEAYAMQQQQQQQLPQSQDMGPYAMQQQHQQLPQGQNMAAYATQKQLQQRWPQGEGMGSYAMQQEQQEQGMQGQGMGWDAMQRTQAPAMHDAQQGTQAQWQHGGVQLPQGQYAAASPDVQQHAAQASASLHQQQHQAAAVQPPLPQQQQRPLPAAAMQPPLPQQQQQFPSAAMQPPLPQQQQQFSSAAMQPPLPQQQPTEDVSQPPLPGHEPQEQQQVQQQQPGVPAQPPLPPQAQHVELEAATQQVLSPQQSYMQPHGASAHYQQQQQYQQQQLPMQPHMAYLYSDASHYHMQGAGRGMGMPQAHGGWAGQQYGGVGHHPVMGSQMPYQQYNMGMPASQHAYQQYAVPGMQPYGAYGAAPHQQYGHQQQQYMGHHQQVLPSPVPVPEPPIATPSPEPKHVVVDARKLLKLPDRSSRPKRVLVVLRGLPGSGKSHIAKAIRDAEVEAGAAPPRILSMDEYFITEVEKEVAEEEAAAPPSGRRAAGSKKKKVIELEYVYDADMEAEYMRNLCRSATRALEEGRFTFLVVDAPNIKLEDFKELWATAQRCHYEAYILKPLDSDPVSCHARNTHGRSLEEIRSLAAKWEAPPALYTLLDFGPMLRAAAGPESIQEVDMGDEEEEQAQQRKEGEEEAAGAAGSGAGDAAAAAAAAADSAEVPVPVASSRWSVADPEEAAAGVAAAGSSSGKRGRGLSDKDLLRELNSELEAAGDAPALAGPSRMPGGSCLAGSGGAKRARLGRRVWWPDQKQQPTSGFMVQTSKKLEEVYILEGLGPAKGDTALQYMLAPGGTLAPGGLAAGQMIPGLSFAHSFIEQVKAEHSAEHELLKHLGDFSKDEEE